MPFSINLDEEALRSMRPELRDAFIKWYFDKLPTDQERGSRSDDRGPISMVSGPDKPQVVADFEDSSVRITFPELLSVGLIHAGDEVRCRALKRQKRHGAGEFIAGARVGVDGGVEFHGRKYIKPSKLALAMVNSEPSSGKPAVALNGYDYLFVQNGGSFVPLEDLRQNYSGPQLGPNGVRATSEADGHVGEVRAKVEKLANLSTLEDKTDAARKILRAAQTLARALSSPTKHTSVEEALKILEEKAFRSTQE